MQSQVVGKASGLPVRKVGRVPIKYQTVHRPPHIPSQNKRLQNPEGLPLTRPGSDDPRAVKRLILAGCIETKLPIALVDYVQRL